MTVLWPNGSTSTPRVSSEYGMRTNPVTGVYLLHAGIDLVGWSTIVSPVNGVVTFAGYNGGAGNEVRIKADNGDVFRLLHNREIWVRQGQRVGQGQGVAVMGTTGQSTGVHCHEETRPGGGASINPRTYYAMANAQPAGGGGTKPVPPAEITKKESKMIHAAWRDTNGTIAVQCVPGGKITQLQDPYDWLGMAEGSRAGYAQVDNAKFQAIMARYGTVPYPTFDTGAPASQLAVVWPIEGGDSRYVLIGNRLFPIYDIKTMAAIQDQGVAYFGFPQAQIDAMLETPKPKAG